MIHLEFFLVIRLLLTQQFLPHIRRIADHRIETTAGENLGERILPTERLNLTLPSEVKFSIIKIHIHQAVPATDIVVEAGKHPFVPKVELLLDAGLGLSFEAF